MLIKNKTHLAKILGISRPTLLKRIKSGEIELNKIPKGFNYIYNEK